MKAFQIIFTVAVLGAISNMPTEAKAQNPIVGGDSRTDVYYDPFNDHTYVKREQVKVRESAFDPGRSYVDPGSQRYIDRYFRDSNGQMVREFGWTWTSYGRPHGKLTRQRVRYYPNPRRPGYGRPGYGRPGYGRPGYGRPDGGTTIDDRETVVFDAGSRSNRKNAGPKKGNNRSNNNRRRTGRNQSRNNRPVTFGFAR